MNNEVVIKVENLYKEYRLGTISHGTLYRDLQSWWARMRGKEDPNSIIGKAQSAKRKESHAMRDNPHMLALNDVSFEVKRGEVLGIIGRNGAGKSTLLKILSEVTAPTKGTVKIKGRVASLLEVGTGFHPELTGRENIYLNGAILGMTKKEIANKFDEIVAFAEIEKFIDTPVKRYSSGMYVRLAFAVAAHLEQEILIVDEVLAVGDTQFQKKCLGKMGDVAKSEGRTILFVSHNMSAISNLCSKTIYMESGAIKKLGSTDSVIPLYLHSQPMPHSENILIKSYINTSNISGSPPNTWSKGTEAAIEITWDRYQLPPGWECDIACYSIDGTKIFSLQSQNLEGFHSKDPDVNCVTFFIENIGFSERDLRVDIGFRKGPNEPYNIVINDALLLRPDGKSLPAYRRSDVIVVPKAYCITSKR